MASFNFFTMHMFQTIISLFGYIRKKQYTKMQLFVLLNLEVINLRMKLHTSFMTRFDRRHIFMIVEKMVTEVVVFVKCWARVMVGLGY